MSREPVLHIGMVRLAFHYVLEKMKKKSRFYIFYIQKIPNMETTDLQAFILLNPNISL